jgi:hypothetical protein
MHGDRIGASVPRPLPSSQNGAARLSIATSADHRAGDTRDRILRVPLAIIDHAPATISPSARLAWRRMSDQRCGSRSGICCSAQFGNGPKPSNSPCTRPPADLFFFRLAPYIGGAGSPAMEINDRRNKPFGPGGSTRRLHPSPPWRVSAGAKQDRRGRKGRVFSRYGSAVIGLCNSCKRQLCSGCSGCVTQFERPSLKS